MLKSRKRFLDTFKNRLIKKKKSNKIMTMTTVHKKYNKLEGGVFLTTIVKPTSIRTKRSYKSFLLEKKTFKTFCPSFL